VSTTPLAFGKLRTSQVQGAIIAMRNKARDYTTIDVSNDDLFKAFVHAGDRDLLVKAAELTEWSFGRALSFRMDSTKGGRVHCVANLIGGTPWLVPKYTGTGRFTQDIPEGVAENIRRHVDRMVDIEHAFGCTWDLFNHLNTVCSSPEQVRFYFGGIVPLLKFTEDEQCKLVATKLAQAKMPRSLPRLDPPMREFARYATRRCSMVMLLTGEKPKPGEVTMGITGVVGCPTPWAPHGQCTVIS